MEWTSDPKKRRDLEELLNTPTQAEAEAVIASLPAYDDPWHVPGLKPPPWAETEVRL